MFNPLDTSAHSIAYALAAITERANAKDWYVLLYNMETTEYDNEIVFMTLDEAYEEFAKHTASYDNQRVEIMFAPEDGDQEFSDNCVVKFKTSPRRIILYDDYEDYLAYTDAPADLVQAAIDHKNDMLIKDLPIASDFEEMIDFLNDKGFVLYHPDTEPDETYYW